MPNAYHPQAPPIRNQQFPYNNNNNNSGNTRYVPSGDNFIPSNSLMINQRNEQGYDFHNGGGGGYNMNNQRNPPNQCKFDYFLVFFFYFDA